MKKTIHIKGYTRKRHGRAKFGGEVRSHNKHINSGRMGQSMEAKKVMEEVAKTEISNPSTRARFLEFYSKRFPNHTDGGYASQWASRFNNGTEYYMGDKQSKDILKSIDKGEPVITPRPYSAGFQAVGFKSKKEAEKFAKNLPKSAYVIPQYGKDIVSDIHGTYGVEWIHNKNLEE